MAKKVKIGEVDTAKIYEDWGVTTVKTVKITPDNRISYINLQGWSLEELEKSIGVDHIEAVHNRRTHSIFKDSVVIMVDKNGRENGKPYNFIGSFLGDKPGTCAIGGDIIFGVYRNGNILPPEKPGKLMHFMLKNFPMLRELY